MRETPFIHSAVTFGSKVLKLVYRFISLINIDATLWQSHCKLINIPSVLPILVLMPHDKNQIWAWNNEPSTASTFLNVTSCVESISVVDTLDVRPATWTFPLTAHVPRKSSIVYGGTAMNPMNMTLFVFLLHQSLTALAFFLLIPSACNASFCNDSLLPVAIFEIQLCSRFSLTPILATPLSARASVTALHTPNVIDLAGAPRVLGTAKAVHDRDRQIREKQWLEKQGLSQYRHTTQRRRRHLAHRPASRRRRRLIAENQDVPASLLSIKVQTKAWDWQFDITIGRRQMPDYQPSARMCTLKVERHKKAIRRTGV